MAGPSFRLTGHLPKPISGPSFTTPIFTGPTNAPWLQDFREDVIDRFIPFDPDRESLVVEVRVQEARSLGDPVLYGFRWAEGDVLFGTRSELVQPLTNDFERLKGRPFTQRAVARFLRDEALLASVKADDVPPAQKFDVPRGQILVLGDLSERRRPLFDAAVFTILACGFMPSTLLEPTEGGITRVERLHQIIDGCQAMVALLGGPTNQSIPFEVGLYMGRAYASKRTRALLLDDAPYRYQHAFSDLVGYDVDFHGGDEHRVIYAVRNFLANNAARDRSVHDVGKINAQFERFNRVLAIHRQQSGDGLNYSDFIALAEKAIAS